MATDVDDARRVLDALGWDKAWVVGHSWGGQLALHVAEALPERLFGVLAVDPLGSVGDGRWPEFDEEIFRRTPVEVRARARELDALTTEGAADDELALEQMRLVWPAYFADPEQAPPMPELRMASERSAQMGRSILAELPVLEAGLPGIRVPSASSTAHGARCQSPLRRTRRTGFPAPGSMSSTVRAISCGSRPQARFAPRFGASPPRDLRPAASRAGPTTGCPNASPRDIPEHWRRAAPPLVVDLI